MQLPRPTNSSFAMVLALINLVLLFVVSALFSESPMLAHTQIAVGIGFIFMLIATLNAHPQFDSWFRVPLVVARYYTFVLLVYTITDAVQGTSADPWLIQLCNIVMAICAVALMHIAHTKYKTAAHQRAQREGFV